MIENKQSNQQFLIGLLGGVAVVSFIGMIIFGVAFLGSDSDNSDKGIIAGQQENLGDTNPAPANSPQVASLAGVSTYFEKAGAEICTEDGKPVVYLFSTTWCPHCSWIGDTFDRVVEEYVNAGKIKAYHWEVDINDNILTSEKESRVPAAHSAIYREFNPQGSIPTFVFGCKYYRIGNGHEMEDDLDAEAVEFKLLIEDLVNSI